jgi:hypothetical protein
MKNITFVIGVPGSRWSGFSNLLTHLSPIGTFDLTDHTPDRFYQHAIPGKTAHSAPGITHQGCYFGPGMGLGENWHLAEGVTRENILQDIAKVWDMSTPGKKLVKSHVLSLHLHKLREEFPLSDFIFVTAPEEFCYNAWMIAGGFERITYPNYSTYYQNPTIMREKLHNEYVGIEEYIRSNSLSKWEYNDLFWDEHFGLTLNSDDTLSTTIHSHLKSHTPVKITVDVPKL